jgi:hypothetical protein
MPPHMLTGGPMSYGGGGGGSLGYMSGMSNPYEYGGVRAGPSAKMALLMGFNHLNTIEEEKHET